MINGRAILTVVLIAAIVWIGVLAVRAHFQAATICHDLGEAVAKVGLRGIGAALLEASASVHQSKLETAEQSKASAEELAKRRKAVLKAELVVAQAYLRSGKPLKTKEHLEAARELDPENPALLLLLSEARMELGEQSDAKTGLLRVVAGDHEDPRAAYLLGRISEAEGKQEDAISWFRQAVEVDPESSVALLALAEALATKGSDEEAKKHAQAAVASAGSVREKMTAVKAAQRLGADVQSPSLEVLTVAAHRHWKAGIGAAVCVLVMFSPLFLGVAFKVARLPGAYVCLLMSQRDQRALSLYRYLLARRPGNVGALRILAQEECQSNPLAEHALDLCERWYDAKPDDPEAAAGFARAAIVHHRRDEKTLQACEAWYDQGIEDIDDLQRASDFLCEAYLQTQALDERAIPVCELAAAAQPERHELVRYIGALHHEFGRPEDALLALTRAVELDREDSETRRLLAAAYVSQGQYYQAYRHLQPLASTDEVDSTLYVAGVGSEQDGDASAALRIFKEVARREPSFADVQYRIQRLSPVADQAICGEYVLQFVIGDSPSYKVCAARKGDVQYAMCVFHRDCSDGVRFPELFAGDMRVLEAIQHDVLPRIIEHGEAAEEYYLATERLSGTTVRALLEERGKLSLKESAVIIGEVLRALAHLHSSGVVHGDVSPDNVIVDGEGQVKLLATGLTLIAAKSVGEDRAAHMHCPDCVAPEIVQKQGATRASDIYSAGALLYQMLLGRPVFAGASPLAVMMSHVASEPEPLSAVDASLFADIDAVVMQALAKDPAARHESAHSFRKPLLAAGRLTDESRAVTLGVVGTSEVSDQDGEWWGQFDNVSLMKLAWGAKIYRAVLRTENQTCAVKELSVSRVVSSNGNGRVTTDAQRACQRLFQNEVHLLRHIGKTMPHKGIVAVYDAWMPQTGHTGAYWMELLASSLEDRLAEGRLPEQEAVDILVGVCDAVGHLHGHDLVHQHLTPSAVMFDAEANVRLVGFDRACRLKDSNAVLAAQAAIQAAASAPAEALGKAGYAAPEQCKGEPCDKRADVYSLGCLLFCMLAGRPPFSDEDPVALMLKQLSEAPPALDTLGIEVSPAVQTFLDKALAKDQEERFADANEARSALISQTSVSASAAEGQPTRLRIQV